jgi:hypothetical protein
MGADDDDVAVDVDVDVAVAAVAVNIIQRTITFITLSCPNVFTSHLDGVSRNRISTPFISS